MLRLSHDWPGIDGGEIWNFVYHHFFCQIATEFWLNPFVIDGGNQNARRKLAPGHKSLAAAAHSLTRPRTEQWWETVSSQWQRRGENSDVLGKNTTQPQVTGNFLKCVFYKAPPKMPLIGVEFSLSFSGYCEYHATRHLRHKGWEINSNICQPVTPCCCQDYSGSRWKWVWNFRK